jgi:hypothetical protein
MTLIPTKCIDHEKRKVYVVSEKGKSYSLQNQSDFLIKVARVDKCFPQNEGEKRCDYLMYMAEKKMRRAIFIELKGGDLAHGIKQVYETLIYLKPALDNYRLDARIIGNRNVPNLISLPIYRKLAKEILPTRGKIKFATNGKYSENI